MNNQKEIKEYSADKLIEQIKMQNEIYLQLIKKIKKEKNHKTLSIEEKLKKVNDNKNT